MIRNRTTTYIVLLICTIVLSLPLAGGLLAFLIWWTVDTDANPFVVLLLGLSILVTLLILVFIGTLIWRIRKESRIAAALLDQLNPAHLAAPPAAAPVPAPAPAPAAAPTAAAPQPAPAQAPVPPAATPQPPAPPTEIPPAAPSEWARPS